MFAIKFRKKGDKAWWFSTPDGSANRLTIYAARFDTKEKAKEAVDKAKGYPQNADLEFKVVSFGPTGTRDVR